jgi:hypothetical protein
MRAKLLLLPLILLLLIPSLSACDPIGVQQPAQDAIAAIQAAISQLDSQSADWKNVLQSLEDQLVKDGQSTIRNEVNDVLQRAEQAAASNILCVIDFLRVRVQEDLKRILEKLENKPVDPVTPVACSAVPDAIDLTANLNKVTIAGYNFDTTPGVQAFLVDGTQVTDVSQFLFRTSAQYELVLNIGTGGVPVSKVGQSIVLKWQGTTLLSIPVIETSPPCQTINDSLQIPPITIIPPLVRGDANFGGNGPRVSVVVYPSYSQFQANIIVTVDFTETNGGDTYATAGPTYTIYTPPAGWRIKTISNSDISEIDYTHSSSNNQDILYPGTGYVEYFLLKGFEGNNAAGVTAQVTIYFRPLTVERVQVTGCHQP